MSDLPELDAPVVRRTPTGVEYVLLSDIDPLLRDECLAYARGRGAVLLIPDDTTAVFVEEWRDWVAQRAEAGVESPQPPVARTNSYWNLRVIEFENGEDSYSAVHRVHYHPDGRLEGYAISPAVMLWTVEDGPAAARAVLEQFQRAFSEPPLKASDFE